MENFNYTFRKENNIMMNNVKKKGSKSPGVFNLLLLAVLSLAVITMISEFATIKTESKQLEARHQEKNHTEVLEEQCNAMVDRFDSVFDEQRKARQNFIAEMSDEIGFNIHKKWFWDLYEPEANCFADERFGYLMGRNGGIPQEYAAMKRHEGFGDGPKFVCGVDFIAEREAQKKENDDPCLVYSVGSHNKIDFEMMVKKFLGCETHTFDPTIRKDKFVGDDFAIFHQWGIGEDGVKTKKWIGKSFDTIIKELGHKGRTIDILKIDCEGCEWKSMPPLFDAIANGTLTVNQIQIEMHIFFPGSPRWKERDAFFDKMDQAKMRIFHKERNQWGCDGYTCLEYAFVSEEFLRNANRAALCNL